MAKKKTSKNLDKTDTDMINEWTKKNKITKIGDNVSGGENIITKSFFTRRRFQKSKKTEK